MTAIKPRIFVSYARKDTEFVQKLGVDLSKSGIDCWIDLSALVAGDRLKRAIFGQGIPDCNLFFAYITEKYIQSRWCMEELRTALKADRVMVVPFADSSETRDLLPMDIRDEVHCGLIEPDNYWASILELSGKAWASLQTVRRLVPSENHILASPTVFDSEGYTRKDLLSRVNSELILAASNLRSWLSDPVSRQGLVDLVRKGRRLTLIAATYETLRPISAEGAVHLRQSVEDIHEMRMSLGENERKLIGAYFHVGAATLSAVFIDPEEPNGILFFNPRWAIQFLPQDRLTCVIDKTTNSGSLFKAIYNGVFLMTQRDAKSVEEMLSLS